MTATVFVPHRVSCRPRSARSWITATGPLFVFWHRNENGCMTVRHTKEPRLTGWLDVDDSRGKMQFSEIRSVPLVICLLRVKSPCVVGSWYVIQKEEIFIIFSRALLQCRRMDVVSQRKWGTDNMVKEKWMGRIAHSNSNHVPIKFDWPCQVEPTK